jgi:hypothetical protein
VGLDQGWQGKKTTRTGLCELPEKENKMRANELQLQMFAMREEW